MIKNVLSGMMADPTQMQQLQQMQLPSMPQMPQQPQPIALDPYGQQMGGVRAALMGRMLNGF